MFAVIDITVGHTVYFTAIHSYTTYST
jgi:hypothetical protein